ncbi:MAG: hypothetical protein ACP5M5_12930, partial [Acidibrevibacterium sp.]|uniref:hypothetical protein n=1 Tax=Acidibrevibacterium sp. TaxID=2606776 RepID=UPI003D023E1A
TARSPSRGSVCASSGERRNVTLVEIGVRGHFGIARRAAVAGTLVEWVVETGLLSFANSAACRMQTTAIFA